MPEGVGYGTQNTVSIGLNLNIIGRHAYAYSGSVNTDNNETDLLDFTTGNTYMVGKCQPSNNFTGGTDSQFKIYIDGILVMVTHLASSSTGTPFEEMELIIPPYSTVRVTGANATDSGTIAVMAAITGRIYGKIE